ncbi:hypothetical protein [uncultured Nostoc sp.]|uniref:hypothetical protein n=1 Tax=uncultured Nostoc sp. TaxID=340711 RepID=UPI0035C9822F
MDGAWTPPNAIVVNDGACIPTVVGAISLTTPHTLHPTPRPNGAWSNEISTIVRGSGATTWAWLAM